MNDLTTINNQAIQSKIHTIRYMQVMLDRDLAELYGVETRVLKQAVKRNIERFPEDFMFQMNKAELENWKSQIATSNSELMRLRKLPFVFTEQGVSMLATILKSKTASQTTVLIIKTFASMRKFVLSNASIFQRLDTLETKQVQSKLDLKDLGKKVFGFSKFDINLLKRELI